MASRRSASRPTSRAHRSWPGQPSVALYQLVPLLVHVIMFGGSWTAALARTVAACG
ncbi:MAG: hypothetical protein U0168_14095 [Nannocystaceae bacterium]